MRAAGLLALACAAFSTAAGAQQLGVGEYLTERGWGTLAITRDANRLGFSIEAVGGNQHVCGLDGDILGGKAVLEAHEPRKPCVVTFTPRRDGIEVKANDGRICNFFCGAHARFEGLYLKVSTACLPKSVKQNRAAFKLAYDRKDYAAAQAHLAPMLADCARTLDPIDEGWMRNDLALAQYRAGDSAACRRSLQTLEKAAAQDDESLRVDRAPIDGERYVALIKAVRTNLKLCRAR
jgi:hypothetical protein